MEELFCGFPYYLSLSFLPFHRIFSREVRYLNIFINDLSFQLCLESAHFYCILPFKGCNRLQLWIPIEHAKGELKILLFFATYFPQYLFVFSFYFCILSPLFLIFFLFLTSSLYHKVFFCYSLFVFLFSSFAVVLFFPYLFSHFITLPLSRFNTFIFSLLPFLFLPLVLSFPLFQTLAIRS